MTSVKRVLALILSFSLISLSLSNVQAAIVSNQQLMQQVSEQDSLLQTINRADVQQQLASMGVNPADVEARIKHMTQDELVRLNQQIAALPAGADGLGIIVLIFVVFVITDVLGATDIFPFIHPVR